ncbi:hypothetical protein [Actinocorallia sp. API 0066]|nr:hypothetical protein [Actinocorallia sp. API 0066]
MEQHSAAERGTRGRFAAPLTSTADGTAPRARRFFSPLLHHL